MVSEDRATHGEGMDSNASQDTMDRRQVRSIPFRLIAVFPSCAVCVFVKLTHQCLTMTLVLLLPSNFKKNGSYI